MMRIAVNARLLLKGRLEGIGWHAWELLTRIIKSQHAHTFILYYDRKEGIQVPEGKNVIFKSLNPVTRHPILLHYWTEISLKQEILKDKIDIYYSPEPILPSGLTCKTVITIHDISPILFPGTLSYAHRKYYQYLLPLNANKASSIITVSNFSKSEIEKNLKVSAKKISVVHNAARSSFYPLPKNEKTDHPNKHTINKKYFLSISSINKRKNIHKIIQAFDSYKSKTKLDYKLVLVGKRMGSYPALDDALNKSSNKNDIVFTGYLQDNEINHLLNDAIALINLSDYEGFGMQLVEALAVGTNVIASDRSCYPEILASNGIIVNPENISEIVEAMMNSDFFNENVPRILYNWDYSASQIINIFTKD